MGYGYGVANGKEVGYSVEATCDHPGCNEKIDRGIAYACGGDHGEDEHSCDGYFCDDHVVMTPIGQLCEKCYEKWSETPEGKAHQEELRKIFETYANRSEKIQE